MGAVWGCRRARVGKVFSRVFGFPPAVVGPLLHYILLVMAAFLARRLYPDTTTLETWDSVDNACTWSGVLPASWSCLLDKAGAGESPQLMIVVALPVHGIIELTCQWVDRSGQPTPNKSR